MALHDDSGIYNPDGYARLRAFGPFIDADTYVIQPTTYRDLIIGSVVFGLAIVVAILAVFLAIQQTKAAKRPLHSVYVWMIWTELAACVVIDLECLLYLLYVVRPSFYFYMSICRFYITVFPSSSKRRQKGSYADLIVFLWSIQIQLLLQIIINRIRIILPNRKKGRVIVISVAIFITLINISVFCIWMPARLEISERYAFFTVTRSTSPMRFN